MLPVPTNLITDSIRLHLTEAERQRQEDVITFRKYYEGLHDTQLTDRQRRFLELQSNFEFNINYCPIVVDSIAERLNVTGIDAGEQSEQMWDWWDDDDLDGKQGLFYMSAIRDGESYALVEWANEEQRPRFTFEFSVADNEGVKVHYNPERRTEIAFASKRWKLGHDADKKQTFRLNLYFDNRIEKYIRKGANSTEAQWRPFEDEDTEVLPGALGDAGVVWWTESKTANGIPLGVPIIPFVNREQGYGGGQSELRNIISIQNAFNKTVIDLLAAADVSAFPILVLVGGEMGATTMHPGTLIDGIEVGGGLTRLPGEDLSSMIQLKDSFASEIARVSRTPVSFFQISGQRAAEGTLKQEEVGLVAKVEKLQVSFGNSWERAFAMARRLNNAFGEDGNKMKESQKIRIRKAQWANAVKRDELQHLQALRIKKELGVSMKQLWAEMEYPDDKIQELAKAMLRRSALAIRQSVNGDSQPNGNKPKPDQEDDDASQE